MVVIVVKIVVFVKKVVDKVVVVVKKVVGKVNVFVVDFRLVDVKVNLVFVKVEEVVLKKLIVNVNKVKCVAVVVVK